MRKIKFIRVESNNEWKKSLFSLKTTLIFLCWLIIHPSVIPTSSNYRWPHSITSEHITRELWQCDNCIFISIFFDASVHRLNIQVFVPTWIILFYFLFFIFLLLVLCAKEMALGKQILYVHKYKNNFGHEFDYENKPFECRDKTNRLLASSDATYRTFLLVCFAACDRNGRTERYAQSG